MRLLAFVFLCVCSVTAHGQVPSPAAAPDSSLVGRYPAPFLALSVADLDRELAWYRDVLGFRIYSAGILEPRKIRYALLLQGSAFVELLQIPGARSRRMAVEGLTDPSQQHGFFKSGMVVEDVDALFAALEQRGVSFTFRLTHPPGGPFRAFGVTDPEGNLLQFFGR